MFTSTLKVGYDFRLTPSTADKLLIIFCTLLYVNEVNRLELFEEVNPTRIEDRSMKKFEGKVMPKLLGARFATGEILKMYVAIKPASFGEFIKKALLRFAEM